MSEQNGPSNVSTGGMKIDGDRLDMNALRELSVQEYEQEFGKLEDKMPPKKAKAVVEDAEDAAEEDEIEDIFEDEEDGDEKPAKKAKAKPESEDVDADDSEEEVEDDEDDSDADDEDEPDTGKYLTAKSKDGKSYKVPKDAVFEVKIDGKREQLTAQEIMDNASGNIHLAREHTNLGREKVKLKAEREEFERFANTTNENIEMLQDIAESGTPEDFAQYYGMMTGKNPEEVLRGLVERTVKYAEQFAVMTDRERELYNENRKHKFQQKLIERRESKATKQQAHERERVAVDQALERVGLTPKDFLAAAELVKAKLESGEITGKYSAMDIVGVAARMDRETRLVSAINAVDKSLLKDRDFVVRVAKAVASAEGLTGERFSPKEAQILVRKYLATRAKGLSESLSKKVDRHKKSGKTASKNANSRNQEEYAGSLTLADHRQRIWGGE